MTDPLYMLCIDMLRSTYVLSTCITTPNFVRFLICLRFLNFNLGSFWGFCLFLYFLTVFYQSIWLFGNDVFSVTYYVSFILSVVKLYFLSCLAEYEPYSKQK